MKLNVMAFVMMIVAIAVGKLAGGMILNAIGGTFAGGIFGALIVGFICYLVYALVTKSKIKISIGLFFAVFVYIADFVSSYIADMLAIGAGDILLYLITGGVMAVLWSWIGAKLAGSSSGVSTGTPRRRRRR